MRAGQGICVLRQGILGHFRPLLDIYGAKGLFKYTYLFEGRGRIPLPPRCAPVIQERNEEMINQSVPLKRLVPREKIRKYQFRKSSSLRS